MLRRKFVPRVEHSQWPGGSSLTLLGLSAALTGPDCSPIATEAVHSQSIHAHTYVHVAVQRKRGFCCAVKPHSNT